MLKISAYQALLIHIANLIEGKDKLTFKQRCEYVMNTNLDDLEKADTKKPYQLREAVKALNDVKQGKKVSIPVNLDATASGIQIMSIISCDRKAGELVNISNSSIRSDIYSEMAKGLNLDRKTAKTLIMVFFYNGRRKAYDLLGDEAAVKLFKLLDKELEGPSSLLKYINKLWMSNKSEHSWTMPDGHEVIVPVESKIQISYSNLIYSTEHRGPSEFKSSLAPNFIHSLDAWICREVITNCFKRNVWVYHTHDCFYSLPSGIQAVREEYKQALKRLCIMDMNKMFKMVNPLAETYIPTGSKQTMLDLIEESDYLLS